MRGLLAIATARSGGDMRLLAELNQAAGKVTNLARPKGKVPLVCLPLARPVVFRSIDDAAERCVLWAGDDISGFFFFLDTCRTRARPFQQFHDAEAGTFIVPLADIDGRESGRFQSSAERSKPVPEVRAQVRSACIALVAWKMPR